MGTLSREAIQLVCDGVLIRNALVLRHSLEVIEEAGSIPDDCPHIEEIRHSLQLIEEEIERRGLKLLEGEEQGGFLKGMAYTSES